MKTSQVSISFQKLVYCLYSVFKDFFIAFIQFSKTAQASKRILYIDTKSSSKEKYSGHNTQHGNGEAMTFLDIYDQIMFSLFISPHSFHKSKHWCVGHRSLVLLQVNHTCVMMT